MAVTIEIKDGPASSPWLSGGILPGRLNGNSFTVNAGNSLARNQRFDFKITVHNTGSDETESPVGSGPTGPFVTAVPLVVGGTSPSGTTSATVSTSAGFPQLVLYGSSGQQLWSTPLPTSLVLPVAQSYAFGYAPGGRYFVVITQRLQDLLDVEVIAAERIGSGASAIQPGARVYSTQVPFTGGATQFSSDGLGFVPTRDFMFMNWTSSNSTAFQIVDLRAGRGTTDYVAQLQAGQFLFSPGGDLLAVIGQPAAQHNEILLYTLPALDRFEWRSKGMPVSALTVGLPWSLFQTRAAGFDAIVIRSGPDSRTIDSPTPGLPAVAVYLWVDKSSTVFSTTTATQYPGGAAGSQNPPSAFIDRIGARDSEDVVIDANWLAVTPPPGEHFCAIAEAFTTAGTQPPDPRQRTGVTLSLLERQIAQRNLVVGP